MVNLEAAWGPNSGCCVETICGDVTVGDAKLHM